MFHRVLVLVWSLCCRGALAENSTGPHRLRLVRGHSRCQGELQIQRRGQDWIDVSPLSVPLWFGDKVCAALDCGSVLSVEKKNVVKNVERDAAHLDPWKDPLLDNSFDSDVRRSNWSLEVNCSDSVRLASEHTCSGSLQIRDQSLNQSWTPVCEGALDRRGAEVLCRELGCGAPRLQGAPSLGQMFHCEGHESALMDCPRNQTRTEPGTCSPLHLTCSYLRLVGGASRCEGTLEVVLRGEWRPVTVLGPWNLMFASFACQELDCGSAVSTYKRDYIINQWPVWHTCLWKKNALLRDCIDNEFPIDRSVTVTCSDSVRLVSGRSLCSGSLKIRDQSLDQYWTPVCEGALDRRGAEVLCRELGCGAPLLQGESAPLGQMFHCEGNESALMDCPRNQTRTEPGTCSPLHLTCSEPLRLVGGASRCEGIVEVKYRGEWRRATTFYPPADPRAGPAVCRDLDCGSVVSTAVKRSLVTSDVWLFREACVETVAVKDCVHNSIDRKEAFEVVCSDSVRLVSGRTSCSGSLQIRDQSLDQSWTPVCKGALDRRGAEVVCRELGCGAPRLKGAPSPLGQMFHCEGHESALMDCPQNQTRTEAGTCSPLRLKCSEPLRLVGGASHCEGIVELKYRGEWRRAVAINFPGDLEAATAVCRHLGCGSVVSAAEKRGLNSTEVWNFSKDCVKTAPVKECVYSSPMSDNGLEVVCSGHQGAP